jgi:hypothetical protein
LIDFGLRGVTNPTFFEQAITGSSTSGEFAREYDHDLARLVAAGKRLRDL